MIPLVTQEHIRQLMKQTWDAAVLQCANVQEKGWTYIPLTFDKWYAINHSCEWGHDYIPVMGYENSVTGYVCRHCGEPEPEQEAGSDD